MESDLHNAAARKNCELSGESRAFVRLEMARLRCEALMACVGRRDHLVAIHREIGLAGFVTCEPFDVDHRRDCLALAAVGLVEDPVGRVMDSAPGGEAPGGEARGGEARGREGPGGDQLTPAPAELSLSRTLATMFAETIAASDALASELAGHDVGDAQRDRLHLVHAHVMSACELLDERLTLLELANAGTDAAI